MLTVEQRRQFLLDWDALHNTSYRVWVGVPIIQANGSHPRVRQLSAQKAMLTPGLEDTAIAWEVRIVKSPELAPLIRADIPWAISLDSGLTQQVCRVLPPIREHSNAEVAWVVTLRK